MSFRRADPMSPSVIKYLVLFVLSEVAGVLIGEQFFRLYLRVVPPMALSSFNTDAAHVTHYLYGVGVGVVLFIWTILGAMVDRLVRLATKPKASATT
jgi:hypothetical protein